MKFFAACILAASYAKAQHIEINVDVPAFEELLNNANNEYQENSDWFNGEVEDTLIAQVADVQETAADLVETAKAVDFKQNWNEYLQSDSITLEDLRVYKEWRQEALEVDLEYASDVEDYVDAYLYWLDDFTYDVGYAIDEIPGEYREYVIEKEGPVFAEKVEGIVGRSKQRFEDLAIAHEFAVEWREEIDRQVRQDVADYVLDHIYYEGEPLRNYEDQIKEHFNRQDDVVVDDYADWEGEYLAKLFNFPAVKKAISLQADIDMPGQDGAGIPPADDEDISFFTDDEDDSDFSFEDDYYYYSPEWTDYEPVDYTQDWEDAWETDEVPTLEIRSFSIDFDGDKIRRWVEARKAVYVFWHQRFEQTINDYIREGEELDRAYEKAIQDLLNEGKEHDIETFQNIVDYVFGHVSVNGQPLNELAPTPQVSFAMKTESSSSSVVPTACVMGGLGVAAVAYYINYKKQEAKIDGSWDRIV